MELIRPERTSAPAPPWQALGGVSTVDSGRFAESVAAMRQNRPLSKAQLDAVIDEIVRAREAGADLVCLDPTAPPQVRLPAFSAIMRPAIARGAIPDLTLSDERTLHALYDAALSWGHAVQRLLDDPAVTEVKINGTTALASSARGPIVVPDAYSTVDEPHSRVKALAQLMGVTWDTAHPSVTIPLSNKTRLHATRAPLVAEGDLLIVIRRGRSRPWTFGDLVERGALSEEAAAVLTTLFRARLSLIVSGAQDSGKTTFLECVLNALPPHEHIVLVEDNTDEFCLRSRLVTRLQVNTTGGTSAFDIVVRETLRMTPSFLAPGEIRGAEAGAVAQIAEAGRPTATTIHARFPEAALQRFARLAASDIPGNSFARQPHAALRVIAESFHLLVHMVFSHRLNRRIVQSVALLDGLDARREPVLHPLIAARLDESAAGGVRWDCHAAIEAGQLVWHDRGQRVPSVIVALLDDMPTQDGLSATPGIAAEDQVTDLLARARELLPYPDQAAQVVRYLEMAYQLDPHHREIWPLVERLLASNPAIREAAVAAVDAAVQRLQAALTACDLAAIQAAVNVEDVSLIERGALNQDARWQEARAAGTALIEQVEELEAELAAAYAIASQQHDFARALRLLQRFHAPSLPRASARHLLDARIGLLEAQCQLLGPTGSAAITQQLRLAEQQRAALGDDAAPTLRTEAVPESAGPGSEGIEVIGARSAVIEDDLMTLCERSLDIASGQGRVEAPAGEIPRAQLTATETFPDAIRPGEHAPSIASSAELFDEPVPIQVAAAAEVGNWRALWQQVTSATTQEGNNDSHDT